MLEIVPPLVFPPTAVLALSPSTVKLPARFWTTMPLAPPVSAEILRNDSVPLLPVPPMLTRRAGGRRQVANRHVEARDACTASDRPPYRC